MKFIDWLTGKNKVTYTYTHTPDISNENKKEESSKVEEAKEDWWQYQDKICHVIENSFELLKGDISFKSDQYDTSKFWVYIHEDDDEAHTSHRIIKYYPYGKNTEGIIVYCSKDGTVTFLDKKTEWVEKYFSFINNVRNYRDKSWELLERFLDWTVEAEGTDIQKRSIIEKKDLISKDPMKTLEWYFNRYDGMAKKIVEAREYNLNVSNYPLTVTRDKYDRTTIKWYGNVVFDSYHGIKEAINKVMSSDPSWFKNCLDTYLMCSEFVRDRKRHNKELQIIERLHRRLPRNYSDDKVKVDYEMDYIKDEEARRTRVYLRYIIVYDLTNNGKCVYYFDKVRPYRNILEYGDWIDHLAGILYSLPQADYYQYGNEDYQEYKRRTRGL